MPSDDPRRPELDLRESPPDDGEVIREDAGRGASFPIVGVGASAGGLEAFTQFLTALPPDTGMAFVLVQHLAPTRASALTEILSRTTTMPVTEVSNQPMVEANHVYVIPPDRNMVLVQGALQLLPRESRGAHHPIDQFFRSLAEERRHRAIGVVLSGTATDGTLGLEAIKAEGGISFAQDDSAQHDGMPLSAIASGYVDFVLPPADIAREIVRISQHIYAAPEADDSETNDRMDLGQIVHLLRQATGVDFTGYKFNTLYRRVTRRMVFQKMNGLAEYVNFLRQTPTELDALYSDILISVTSFFRDNASFEALKSQVFPRLLKGRSKRDPVRIWTLGCSTGQEAYSLVIALTEAAEAMGSSVPIQLFASDLNAAGIEKARAGIYPKDIAQDVSPERLRRFFAEVEGRYRVSKSIRDACVFSQHNVLTDPPFSRMDLISCRNLLIYLDPVLQRRVMPTLHYALKPGGYLWLGGSETIGSYRNLFEAEDPRHKIYVKKPGRAPGRGHFPVQPGGALRAPYVTSSARPRETDLPREADRILLARYSPASVLVSADLDILQYRGDTSPYLAPMPGKASLNLLKMVREGLLVAVRAAVLQASQEHAAVREEGLRVKTHGGYREVNLEVIPVKGQAASDGGFLVLFEDAAPGAEPVSPPGEPLRAATPDVDHGRLEQELAATREYLQLVIEQQEAANEELQSANEEVQSANEELQSTNEELETSKEEIQSSNEELATVNDELNNRNAELHRVNDDLINLLGSVQMAIVILGPDLRVRRFTPMAERLLNLGPASIGRPFTDSNLRLDGVANLAALLAEVLDTVSAREQDIRDKLGHWYSLRLRPYRTLGNKVDGVVVMLVDVDAMKRVQDRMHASEEVLQHNAAEMLEADRRKNEFLAMLAHELRNPLAPIRNALEILRLTDGDAEAVRTASAIMERHVVQIVRLVDDLLDVSRISRGTVELRRERVDLAPIIHHAVEAAQTTNKHRNHELAVSLPARPIYLNADPTRLAQVVGNLLSNAYKFTDKPGHIRLSVEREGEQAVIRVSDSGIGIAADRLRDIFDMFVQVDTSRARTASGLGIGLTLVKSLVEMHNGSIAAHSPGPGAGSTFTVRLPLAPDDAPAPAATASTPGGDTATPLTTGHRILVVDDNEDAAETIAIMLELSGHRTQTAHNGPDAIDMARRFSPELAFLDIGLPGMSGYEVARRFRADPALRETVLVALTGWGSEDDRSRSREAGFDFHLTKPADLAAINAVLARFLAVRPQPTTSDAGGGTPPT